MQKQFSGNSLSFNWALQVETHSCVCVCVMTLCGCEHSLVLPLVGLACFLQPGCYDWFPDWACRRSGLDPLSSQASYIQVQVTDGFVCLSVNVTVRVLPVFQLCSSNSMFLFIVDIFSVCHLWDRLFCNNTRLNKKSYLDTEWVPADL